MKQRLPIADCRLPHGRKATAKRFQNEVAPYIQRDWTPAKPSATQLTTALPYNGRARAARNEMPFITASPAELQAAALAKRAECRAVQAAIPALFRKSSPR